MTMEEQISSALAKIDFEIEYADTHGGCPPAVKGTKWTGISEAKAALLAAHRAEMSALLDRIEQSLNNHTTPEGHDLLTRSYIKNTLDFERQRIKAEVEGKGE